MKVRCRTCYTLIDVMRSPYLFNPHLDDKLLSTILMECTSVNVAEGDGYSSRICFSCRNELTRYYHFRNRCKKAERLFRANEPKIKTDSSKNNFSGIFLINTDDFDVENDHKVIKDDEVMLIESEEQTEKDDDVILIENTDIIDLDENKENEPLVDGEDDVEIKKFNENLEYYASVSGISKEEILSIIENNETNEDGEMVEEYLEEEPELCDETKTVETAPMGNSENKEAIKRKISDSSNPTKLDTQSVVLKRESYDKYNVVVLDEPISAPINVGRSRTFIHDVKPSEANTVLDEYLSKRSKILPHILENKLLQPRANGFPARSPYYQYQDPK